MSYKQDINLKTLREKKDTKAVKLNIWEKNAKEGKKANNKLQTKICNTYYRQELISLVNEEFL